MSDDILSTEPLSENEKLLRQKFYESITEQSKVMDQLSERLLTLELAIPGGYAAILKLIRGENATLVINLAMYLALASWFLALILTLVALIPKKWVVILSLLKQDPQKFADGLGIQDFFEQSAAYKRRLLIASSILFFIGIFFAIFSIG